jgi:hypothetical protein
MGFSFTIGKLGYDIDRRDGEFYQSPTVVPCDGDPAMVWVDDMGGDGPVRCPSYTVFGNVLAKLPQFKAVFDAMMAYVERFHDWHERYPVGIPCKFYEDVLDDIEKEATQSPEQDAAKRAFWFVKWSRQAITLYGELAAFETPGEWYR